MSKYETADKTRQDKPALAAGVYDNIPAVDYHRIGGLTMSGLKQLKKSPAHFWHWMNGEPEEPTKALMVGTATHTAVFEPHKWDEEVVVVPEDAPKKPTKAQMEAKKPSDGALEAIAWWKEFQEKAGKRIILTKEEADEVMAMASQVRNHKDVIPYLTHPSAKVETSIVSVEKVKGLDIPCKGRCDMITMDNTVIIDLKTTEDASAEGFGKSFMSYGYWLQAAHYIAICRASGIPIQRFIFIAVEKSPPFCTALYELDEASLEKAFAIRKRLMENLSDCISSGEFPAYTSGVTSLSMPPWIS